MTHLISRARFSIAVVALCLAGCGGGGSDSGTGAGPITPPEATIGRVVTSTLASTNNGFTYPISVYLPQSYDAGTSATYPVIYATEGDAPYGVASGSGFGGTISRFDTFRASMQQRGTQAILVGIGGTARRGTDFLLPTALAYRDFIVKELVPKVESTYRVNTAKRALSGLSHGGYFVNTVLFDEGASGKLNFTHYLSTESSTGDASTTALLFSQEQKMFDAHKPLPVTLLLAAGAPGGVTNNELVRALYARMTARNYPGLTLVQTEYATSHVGADVPAFNEALARYFP